MNTQLASDLPQLINLRVPYIEPSFEALIKCNLHFCGNAQEKMQGIRRYFPDWDPHETWPSTGHLEGRVENVLQQMRELTIVGMNIGS